MCAFVTGAVDEREDDYGGYQYTHGISAAGRYREEEDDYPFPVRQEYHGYYDEPSYWMDGCLYIYLERLLNEKERDIVKRRTQKFATERQFQLLSVQEIELETVITMKEHEKIL